MTSVAILTLLLLASHNGDASATQPPPLTGVFTVTGMTSDDRAELQLAIDWAIAYAGPAVVELPQNGTLTLTRPPQNPIPPLIRMSPVPAQRVHPLTIAGRNATIEIASRDGVAFFINRLNGVRVENLTIRYNELPFTQGTVSNLQVDPTHGGLSFLLTLDEVSPGVAYPHPTLDTWLVNNTDAAIFMRYRQDLCSEDFRRRSFFGEFRLQTSLLQPAEEVAYSL